MHRRLALLALAGIVLASSAAMGSMVTVLWPDGSGHVHSDPVQHAGLGFGTQLVSYVNVGQAIGEVDVKTDAAGKTWVLAAMLGGGFAIIDGTDPASPVLVSKTNAISAYGADAKLSDDSNTVYLGLNAGGGNECSLSEGGIVPILPRKLACGVQVWDATLKDKPQFIGTLPTSTGGTHMFDYEVLNGVPFLASVSGYGTNPPGMIAVAPANKLPVGVGGFGTASMHDVTLAMDPLQAGRALAISADGYQHSVSVWDITLPVAPVLLGKWTDSRPQYVHTVHVFVVEGKRVLGIAEECFTGGSLPCALWFVDATDFGNMVTLGKWTNPDGRPPSNFVRWSTHNFEVQDGKLYMGHYHGGAVVLDVDSLADLANPPLLANYLASKPRVSGSFSSDVPYTWDAVPHGGVVWVSDINTGLYAVRLT